MPKIAKELSPLAVKRLKKPGYHRVGGCRGLCLQVVAGDDGVTARTWVLVYSSPTIKAKSKSGEEVSKRREFGLGPFPEVSLQQARDKGDEARGKIEAGIDPIEERDTLRSAALAAAAGQITFKAAAAKWIKAHQTGEGNAKHKWQVENTIERFAIPVLGRLYCRDIEARNVADVLELIWTTNNTNATRLRGRIEAILDWAQAHGYRTGPNPARWKGNLEFMLASPSKIRKVEHQPAVPIGQIGEFVATVRKVEGVSARALEFLTLTAARSGEVRLAKWSEIEMADRTKALWTIPADRMKAGKEHRVPLSDAALAILDAIPRVNGCEFVFVNAKGKTLSEMAMLMLTRRMLNEKGEPRFADPTTKKQATPHGLRSSFRDWVSERTSFAREVAEQALAHMVENKVEAAYRRTDLLDKRRQLMTRWAEFCAVIETPTSNVVPIGQRAAEVAA